MPGISVSKIATCFSSSIWAAWWNRLISATVENAAPTDVVLTFPTGKPSLLSTDLTCTVNGSSVAINSISWTGAILTVVLASSVIYGDVVVINLVKTGQTVSVANNAIESEIVTYINGLATPLSEYWKIILNYFVKRLKDRISIANLSNFFDFLYVLWNETSEVSLKNIVKDAHHGTLSVVNPIYTAFDNWKGDGTNLKYIDTHFNPATEGVNYKVNDGALGVYINALISASGKYDMGAVKDGKYAAMSCRFTGDLSVILINGTGGTNPANNVDTSGLFIASRPIGDIATMRRNNISLGTRTYTASGLPDTNIFILCRNNGTNGELPSVNPVSLALASKGISEANDLIINQVFTQLRYNLYDYQLIAATARLDTICYAGNNTLLMGSRNPVPGHIYRSINLGDIWVDLGDITGDTEGVMNIKSDENGICYALTYSMHIWKSINNGEDWTDLGQIAADNAYALLVTSNGTLLVGDRSGNIWRSTNEGISWENVYTCANDIYIIKEVGDGILLTDYSFYVYKSINDGEDWIQSATPIGASHLFGLVYLGNGVCLVGSNNGNIFRSINNGEDWTDLGVIAQYVDSMVTDGMGTVYLFTYSTNKKTYKSIDLGITWDIGSYKIPSTDFIENAICINGKFMGGTNIGYFVKFP
jgi:hypothetical protein